MTIITRKRADQYAIIPNAVASDDRLTFEERGVLVYLLAKPHDWNVSVKNLQNQGGIGRDKVYRILQKLEEVGYLKREQTKSSDGRFGAYNYIVHDDAVPESLPLPRPENQEAGAPRPENTETASPLPEKPVTGNPLNGEADTYKEPIEQNLPPSPPSRGGLGDDFGKLVSGYPADKVGDLDTALRAYRGLTDVERGQASACMALFVRAMILRGVRVPKLATYLSERRFAEFDGAPDIDKDGHFVITPDRPEWRDWLGSIRAKYGEAGVQTSIRHRKIVRETRWPPDLSLANGVTNLATSGTRTDTASAARA
ncbi:helix-turn-helix domain-containing protein [Mesorhizobium sp. WSM3862]|uniref:helix-turn-helix domain-containing protein n=1 Tax=Mesorhizobium sp. WSM3862 TaxID=632858 RepID=UPI000BB07728|nr:helix-turn-helix domain-containing protein [Mesorhizobium sp. WSM3862]PBB96702.1 hypothetical protein CK224_20660 [Mesorhizobium sp. WSM3862]